MKTILTVSSANMDLNMRVERAPEKGETLIGGTYSYKPGGKGANSAVTLAKLGAHSVFCAALGSDANGNTLRELYDSVGVDTSKILTLNDCPTGLATVTVESDGANRISVFSGANAMLSPEHAVSAVESLKPDAVFCHFEIPFETVAAISKKCFELRIPLVIDAGPADSKFPLEELSPMLAFSPNESETFTFTGIKPTDENSCKLAAKELAKRVKAEYYIIKLGAKGAAVCRGDEVTVCPSYDVKVVDTTAAGDSFTSALTYEYLRSGDMVRACRYGNAVASVTVSRPGASESVPTAAELEAFVKENNIEL